MKVLLFAVWTSFLASKLPCPMNSYTWSKEHCLPKSLFPPVVVNRKHNIIPLPTKINNSRGNRKYTGKWEDGHLVYACKQCPHPGFCAGAGVMSPSGFMPPEVFKGPVARSVLKSIESFPKMAEKISEEVLDYGTAIEWDRRYPESLAERHYRSNSS
jgi:endonuclease I